MFKEGQELIKDRTMTARTDAQVAKVKKVLNSEFSFFRERKGSSKEIGSPPLRWYKQQ